MENPLLKKNYLPIFSEINPEDIAPALKHIITENREAVRKPLEQNEFTWENLMRPLEDMNDRLHQMWSPVSHLHAVMESGPLREAYNACLPILTEYHTEMMQNEHLYRALQLIAKGQEFGKLNAVQQKIIENDLRDLQLAGVHLPTQEKTRYAELQKQLSKLTTQFSENLLDATYGWHLHITDPASLTGLSDNFLQLAEQNAKQRQLEGWVFTLDFPCYSNVMKYLDNRELRWLMYEAYVTRASDQGPNAKKWDNTTIMDDILKTRHEIAQLLGLSNYAEYSLKTKMAKKPEEVLKFLKDLVEKSKPTAVQEIQELQAFAKALNGIERLEAWDLAYYTEKLRLSKFALSEEELRAYFPVDKVMSGMFSVMQKLYGINIKECQGIDTWHPSVQFFEIYDENHNLCGYFYTDLYARPHKREGAWMDDCRGRRLLGDGSLQLPIAFLTCNFLRPLNNQPALLNHDEVQTLFHEFGHCLHHLLTKVDYSPLSGINGVPWDAVEFPSQFLEFWCWDQAALVLISSHIETQETLPDSLNQKLIAAKNFHSGLQMLRQLEFALFDFRIHLEYGLEKTDFIQTILNDVRKTISVFVPPTFNRFQHSFSHIFSGAYAAGYYSYKWAEVLSSDAFSLFEEKGIFDHDTGKSFLKNILEKGGTQDPTDLFIAFRGRPPEINALLRHSGLI